ncbi:GNAT family N-acetyltransferase [Vibrio gazogenes]|uniref:Phosphinothricin acetyltransferase n=1 Tax=Vibrio gazogenes DSM 21264 = NBRC 103151 TaxID=1123492 RepID=A0A1M4TC88_VIBGA|nr:GNAT family N-acetyltransferase [Vibrio gazogenes]USP16058.1 GNAT family N-acetyltransferase [Vibrio gazogenes]SHE41877.1 phosphinothricin acetyltransferase [Vibrio gazogenes DSM 21264] [Vibrio gazogenes DSM 21264 = NBRC 103151]SJN54281.1 Phosphinothricin N-acetyltransferase [Vibrio gazogenes]
MKIRDSHLNDSAAITAIYNHFIRDTTITFEEQPLSVDQMSARLQKTLSTGLPWLVLEVDDEIMGYAYASPWHTRSAYRFTVELTIYLAPTAAGNGFGRKLYSELLERLKQQGIKNVMGVIALPNLPSVRLHESLGFKPVGEFNNIGFKFNRYISVGYWQLDIEASMQ